MMGAQGVPDVQASRQGGLRLAFKNRSYSCPSSPAEADMDERCNGNATSAAEYVSDGGEPDPFPRKRPAA